MPRAPRPASRRGSSEEAGMLTKDFHNSATQYQIAQDYGQWVVRTSPARTVNYRFASHYHPYTETLISKLNTDGLPALLDAAYQDGLERPLAPAIYKPGTVVEGAFPVH